MKLNVSNELKSRLTHAAENGSVIAKDILSEVKKNVPVEEVIRGSYNFFSTKRKRTEAGTFKKIRIVFTACNKDLGHPNFPDRNNPQAPWFPENRTDLEPSTFIELFKNLGPYQPDEINYFCSAISLDSKVTIRLHDSMNDFMEAYLESNYSPISDGSESSLHNSCMRYEDKARNAADFYANFAGAKILVARDDSSNVVGRAIVWNEITLWKSINTPIAASLLDRIYSSHAFVVELIRKQAQEAGILLRRRYNDYTHTTDFTVLNPIEGQEPGTEKYGGRHEHSHLPEHGRVCKQEKICMSQMWEDTYLPGCGILQELSGYVLCIYRIWESPERIISGI